MNKTPLSNIFDIKYGNSLDLTVLELCAENDKNGVNYVSRTRENNGVSARVCMIAELKPFPPGLITVAGSGNSVLEASLQLSPFYTGFHVFVLYPNRKMNDLEKLFYCHCIRKNRYRYNFGRQANKTLKFINVPSVIPPEFNQIAIEKTSDISNESVTSLRIDITVSTWKYFKLKELFKITGSKTTPLLELEDYGCGSFPYVTTQATNNGVQGFYNFSTEKGGILTVDSAVLGYCSYQPLDFSASDHVEKLIPKFEMNKYVALFLVTIINQEQYRYSYGRKAAQSRMKKVSIKLPTKNNQPDWDFMEKFIKFLPFSKSI